jgi:hypothetical protein
MEKRIKQFGMMALLFVCVCSVGFAAGTYDWSTNPGTGAVDDPYQVSTPEQLNSIGSDAVLVTKHYVLVADLNMSPYAGTSYNIIAKPKGFTGTFDGNGHVIYNLTYSTTENESYIGMFGRISGEVRNLVLENVTMVSGGNGIGGLAGLNNGGRITNCQVSGSVHGQNGVGGLCGYNGGALTNCRSSGSVSVSNAGTSHSNFGGVCGWNYLGTISDSYSDVLVSVPTASTVGGLCGQNKSGVITDSHVTGAVEGSEYVGGFCGQNIEQSNIARCSAAGDVRGYRAVGGFCGSSFSSFLLGCCASGEVTATENYTGGLCGWVNASTIIQCSATGDVNGTGGTGGLIGYVGATNVFKQCYALGNVSGTFAVGGLCGYIGEQVANDFEHCYAAGHVSGTGSNVTGFIGQGSAYVIGCFWDVQASGQTAGMRYALPELKGLDTAGMQSVSNFIAAGWDFDFMWFMPESDYPKLRRQMGDEADLYPDLDRDGCVDLADYLALAGYWLADCASPVDCANADLDRSGVVDLGDMNRFTRKWLAGTEPEGMEWVYIEDPGLPGYLGFTGYMSRYETTNAQYCQFLNEAMAAGEIVVNSDKVKFKRPDGYFFPDYYDLSGPGLTAYGAVDGGKARIRFTDGLFTVESGFESHPVTYVTWHGAKAFCSHYGYRLPEEWEWRAAADFDGSYIYGTGQTIDNTLANYEGSVHPDGTTPVGSFGAYGYGLCDMSGNVYEWTDSYNRSTNYSLSNRTVVGGCWIVDQWQCSISSSMFVWTDHFSSFVHSALGFRVCK